jgi:hypothetical protein
MDGTFKGLTEDDMKDLFEVVFEGVNKTCVIQLLIHLISGARCVSDVTCTEELEWIGDGHINRKALEAAINFNVDICVLIKLEDMMIDNVVLPLVLLRLVKYGDKFDVDFSFDANKIKNVNSTLLIKYLHSYAKAIAGDFSVANFFGGMEPASDPRTRRFTNQTAGPLLTF